MEYNLDDYQRWLVNNVTLANAYSTASLRTLTTHIMMGRNYRLITENNTKSKLLYTYLWLTDIVNNAKREFGENWKTDLMAHLVAMRRKNDAQKNLMFWLVGLTAKTSVNLGISKEDLPDVIQNLKLHVEQLFGTEERGADVDNAWLLMMAGSATLNIRGSDKSKVGKQIERVLIRAVLTILGLQENTHFWANIQRDLEVDREADAEILTQRGRIRMEVGLIAAGNQEVTEDKIGRVGRNGIILFDKVGSRTRIYDTANNHGVKLVQIRNNQPLVEIHRHISPLVNYPIVAPPTTEEDIVARVNALPDSIFTFDRAEV
ncbi:MAG: CfrBI family restriction endonuclease [Bacteroidetes bacterium]|nr:CfrBI family restriction endonuclease [Bacteroidota bacterium]